jgi:sec-independent protein translocase protein TatA
MPFGMGFGELVLMLVIVVVVFGATKLPQLGGGLGEAIEQFRDRRQRQRRRSRRRVRPLLRRTSSRRWTPSDWSLVCTAIAAAVFALLTLVLPSS